MFLGKFHTLAINKKKKNWKLFCVKSFLELFTGYEFLFCAAFHSSAVVVVIYDFLFKIHHKFFWLRFCLIRALFLFEHKNMMIKAIYIILCIFFLCVCVCICGSRFIVDIMYSLIPSFFVLCLAFKDLWNRWRIRDIYIFFLLVFWLHWSCSTWITASKKFFFLSSFPTLARILFYDFVLIILLFVVVDEKL